MSAVTVRQLANLGLSPISNWIQKTKIRMALNHSRKVAAVLQANIANDTAALAYIHRQQINLSSQLKDFQ